MPACAGGTREARKRYSGRARDSLAKTAVNRSRCLALPRFSGAEKKEAAQGGFQGSHQT
jgi:hypothetical protein